MPSMNTPVATSWARLPPIQAPVRPLDAPAAPRPPAGGEPGRMSPGIRRVVAFIEANFAERLRLDELAAQCNLSMHRFATVFRRQVGVPPHQYLCQVRVRQAQELLRQGIPPADAAIQAGFFDQSHLTRHFRRQFGVSPGRYAAAARPRLRDAPALA